MHDRSPPGALLADLSPRRAHLVGVSGAGMKALAELLADRGWIVTGCDRDPDPRTQRTLERCGVTVHDVHDPRHLEQVDLLIHSPAIAPEHPELRAADARSCPRCSSIDLLAELTRQGTGVAIAGTHGKSSTTALLASIFQAAGARPTVVCGAERTDNGRSGWSGTDREVLVEACEFRRHFLQLHPSTAVVLGIEPDHFDCYPDLVSLSSTFLEFLQRVPRDGLIVANGDCEITRQILPHAFARVVTFSWTDPRADWHLEVLHPDREGSRVVFQSRTGERVDTILQSPGRHNAFNALAAAACGHELGLSVSAIAEGLAMFRGLRRRLERVGDWHGSPVIDDYAHHPTEIRATLQAVRQAHPDRPVRVIFQPHQLSRTEALLDSFADALAEADSLNLLPVYAAREASGSRCTELSQVLLQRISRRGRVGALIPSLDRVWPTLETDRETTEVILTLGAGDLTRIHYGRIERIPGDYAVR